MAGSRLGRLAEHLVGSRRQSSELLLREGAASELRLDGAASQAAAAEQAPEEPRALTLEQKRELYHRGFVILRSIVPPDVMCDAHTCHSLRLRCSRHAHYTDNALCRSAAPV